MIILLLITGALVFGVFFGHVVGLGLRTRHARSQEPLANPRDERGPAGRAPGDPAA